MPMEVQWNNIEIGACRRGWVTLQRNVCFNVMFLANITAPFNRPVFSYNITAVCDGWMDGETELLGYK